MKTKRRAAGLHPGWWTMIVVAGDRRHPGVDRIRVQPGLQAVCAGDPRVGPGGSGDGALREGEVPRRPNRPGFYDQLERPGESSWNSIGPANYIPANVEAQITCPTLFGAKYVDLIDPGHPSRNRLAAGAVLTSRNVTSEVNTVFQNLIDVLNQVDAAKLNAILLGVVRRLSRQRRSYRQGHQRLQRSTDGDQSPQRDNPGRLPGAQGVQRHLQRGRADILTVLDALSTTSSTISNNAKRLTRCCST